MMSVYPGLRLNLAGHYRNLPSHYILRKRSVDFLLFWILAGQGWVKFRRTKKVIRRGDLVLLPPGEAHEYKADPKDPWDIIWVHFNGVGARWFAQQLMPNRKWNRKLDLDDLILQRWDEMIVASEDPRRCKGVLSHALLVGLLGIIVDRLQPRMKGFQSFAPFDVDRVQNYIHQHLAEPLSLNDLAKQARLSTSYFSRSFSKVFFVSPNQYLIRQRVARAAVLLQETSMKLTEIAQAVGYDDPFYLSRIFRKITGVSPSAHRRITNKS